jgi:hypothetical protein
MIFIIAINHNYKYLLQLRVIIAINLKRILLLQLNELMSIIVFFAMNCILDLRIIPIILIILITIIFNLQDCLCAIHARLHALDLLHQVHSKAYIQAIIGYYWVAIIANNSQ